MCIRDSVITVLALIIIIGGIKNISKVSQVVVPLMAVFYVIAGLIVIFGNISNIPSGVAMIFKDVYKRQLQCCCCVQGHLLPQSS